MDKAAIIIILVEMRIHMLHLVSVDDTDHLNDKVIFHMFLTKCSKPIRPNQPIVYWAYVEDELICSVKYDNLHLTNRSKIFHAK